MVDKVTLRWTHATASPESEHTLPVRSPIRRNAAGGSYRSATALYKRCRSERSLTGATAAKESGYALLRLAAIFPRCHALGLGVRTNAVRSTTRYISVD